jgi:threonine/homoserine/homoserine lactone efflux protein
MLYAFVMTITPGPNNVMLMSSGLIFGLRRTWPHILGIPAGVALQLVLTGSGLSEVFALEPRLQLVLKAVGSLYLLWLAHKLWKASSVARTETERPITFFQALLFQFVNPKAWLMAVTAIAAFTAPTDGLSKIIWMVAIFVAVGLPCIILWAGCGAFLRQALHDPVKLSLANRTMAVLTAATAVLFWV